MTDAMHHRKRIIKLVFYALGALLLLLVCVALLLPKFINTAFFKEKLLQSVSQRISGTVTLRNIAVSFFPVPRLVIDQVGIAVPEKWNAVVADLTAFPEIIPLFSGAVKLSKLQARNPVIALYVSDKEESRPLSVEAISAALKSLMSDAAGLTLSIENGSISLIKNGQAPVMLRQIDARIIAISKKDNITVTLDNLNIATPRLMLSGVFSMRSSSPRLRLTLRGKGLSVGQTKEFVLAAVGEAPSVRNIFDVVREGTVPDITFHSQGDALEELGAIMNMEIKGELEQGSIHVASPRLDFTAVKGAFAVSKGILQGTDIAGTYGNSNIWQASLSLGLKGEDAPFHLETLVRADLKEVLVLLRRLVKDKAFIQELDLVQSLNGIALGRLVLGETLASVGARVAVSDVNLSTRYQRIPFPVTIKGGSFTYDKEGVSVKDLAGAVGQTTFSGIAARLDQGGEPQLAVLSGAMRIDAGEIYRWLASQEKMKATLREISAVSGSIAISTLALNGPVKNPKAWRFRIAGAADNLVIGSPSLPDGLVLRQSSFILSPGSILLDAVRASLLDSSATVSGALTFSAEGPLGTDVFFDAEVGPKGMQWIKTVAGLPRILKVQQRLSLARCRLAIPHKDALSFQGEIVIQGGQTLALDLVREKKDLKISKLKIDDGASRAAMTLELGERSLDLTFSGHLDSSTVVALIELDQTLAGRLTGDFTAHLLKDRPGESTANGRLSGEKIVLPRKPDLPLHIDALSLSAEGGRVTVQSSRIGLDDMVLSAAGTLEFGKEGLGMNVEIGMDRVEWKSLERIMGKEESAATAAAGGSAWSKMPVHGAAKISAREFVYDKFTVSPLQADLSFSPDRTMVHIKRAALCNIAIQGDIELAVGNRHMEIALSAKDQDLGPTIACLSERDSEMTGRFSLDGSLSLPLQNDPPMRGLDGALSFRAGEGRINKSIPLSKLFSLLKVSEYFRGLPDLREEGFTYSTFTLAGDVRQGTLSLKEAVIDNPSMVIMAEGIADLADGKINLTVLASPFKTLDRMQKILPGRKEDGPATLVSMGVRVTGDIKNPDVSPQPLSGISRGLTGVMERVLKAPVRIIEPFKSAQ
jgi:hypothetical protein